MDSSTHNIFVFIATVIAAYRIIYWLVYPGGHRPVSKKSLQHISELRFEENDTFSRYLHDTRTLLFQGYEKYLKNGIPFQMRNPIGELGPMVMLPMKYLDEVKNAPTSLFSFQAFSEKMFFLRYSDAPLQSDAATHVIKVDLNRNLGELQLGRVLNYAVC